MNPFYTFVITLAISGCFSRPQATQAPLFPKLNVADTITVHAKWRTLDKYDRKQTKTIMQYFGVPIEGLDDTLNCFAQVNGHLQIHDLDYYIVDWSDSLRTWGAVTNLYVFIPDSNKYRFLQALAFNYGSEGSQIETASWFFDSNGDKVPELYTRSYNYYVTDDTSRCYDNIACWRFEKTGLKSIPVADPEALKKKLHFQNAMLCDEE